MAKESGMVPLIHGFGLNRTECLLYLLRRHFRFRGVNTDGWFPCSVQEMCDDIKISNASQHRYLKWFESFGFLQVANYGWPCRRYIKLNIEKLRMFNADAKYWVEKIERQYGSYIAD